MSCLGLCYLCGGAGGWSRLVFRSPRVGRLIIHKADAHVSNIDWTCIEYAGTAQRSTLRELNAKQQQAMSTSTTHCSQRTPLLH